MLCLDAIFYSHNLILKFLGCKASKNCMSMTHILLNHTQSVVREKVGKSFTCMTDSCFELTKLCIPDCSVRFCFCGRLMLVVSWDILE